MELIMWPTSLISFKQWLAIMELLLSLLDNQCTSSLLILEIHPFLKVQWLAIMEVFLRRLTNQFTLVHLRHVNWLAIMDLLIGWIRHFLQLNWVGTETTTLQVLHCNWISTTIILLRCCKRMILFEISTRSFQMTIHPCEWLLATFFFFFLVYLKLCGFWMFSMIVYCFNGYQLTWV